MEKATHTHADEMKEEITVYAFTIYTCPVSYFNCHIIFGIGT